MRLWKSEDEKAAVIKMRRTWEKMIMMMIKRKYVRKS